MKNIKVLLKKYIELENEAYLAEVKARYLHAKAEAAAMDLRVRKQGLVKPTRWLAPHCHKV